MLAIMMRDEMVPLKKPVTQVPVTEASSITEGIVTYLSKSSGISIGGKSCHPFLTVYCGADNVLKPMPMLAT